MLYRSSFPTGVRPMAGKTWCLKTEASDPAVFGSQDCIGTKRCVQNHSSESSAAAGVTSRVFFSTIARNYAYDDYSLAYYQAYFGFDGMHAYMSNSGTSFAAPIVSGAVALVRAHYPAATVAQVMQIMVTYGDVKVYDNPIGPKLDIDRAIGGPAAVEQVAAPGAVALSAPWPNPASHATTLRFALPRAGNARVTVLDAMGRNIRTLADGEQPAGAHSVTWDLRDATNHAAAAGLYFVRLESEGRTSVQRLAITP